MKRTTLLIASGGLLALVAIAASVAGGVALGRVLPPAVVGPEASSSHAPTPPSLVSFQGLLMDPATGEPVTDGAYSIVFRIYDVPAAGAALWTETQPAVAVEGGVFSVLLGSVTPLPGDVFAGAERYLGVTVGGDPELMPRQRFVSVAYAMHALTADSANSAETVAQAGVVGLRMEPDATSPNLIGGFSGNSVTMGALGATIGGGGASSLTNQVTDHYGTVGGGRNNQAGDNAGTTADRPYAAVGGGQNNTASGERATVGGGFSNTASGTRATVGGGFGNSASDFYAAVGGGNVNTASGFVATVGGGFSNDATADWSTVGGGDSNTAGANWATVGGGTSNTAGGLVATVPGGDLNSAAGDFSFAAGRRAKIDALHDGAFLFADQSNFNFNSAAANEFAVRSTGGARVVTAIDGMTGVPTAGVKLDPGDTAWEVLSDRAAKENFAAVDPLAILERLSSIPIEEWNYIAQDDSIRHLGPTAQDFQAAFGLSDGDGRYISPIDTDGVALAAIQGLYELALEQRAEIESLKSGQAPGDAAPIGDRSRGAPASAPVWVYLAAAGMLAVPLAALAARSRKGDR